MATYIVFGHLTDQGIRTIKSSPQRASRVEEIATEFGCAIKQMYWTLGQYDTVAIVEASDDESLIAFQFALGAAGNMRTHSMRAFEKRDFGAIVGRLP